MAERYPAWIMRPSHWGRENGYGDSRLVVAVFSGAANQPRSRLVYCLPMRTLVEQSSREAKKGVEKLSLTGPVTVLMGGLDSETWFHYPERPAILIGTQDMLLSRALNRGYAASRFHWPIDFGLLNNDSLWVFDEPQLLGRPASPRQPQLAGLRLCAARYVPAACPSVWDVSHLGAHVARHHRLQGPRYRRTARIVVRRLRSIASLVQANDGGKDD